MSNPRNHVNSPFSGKALRLGIPGCTGRMGQSLVREIRLTPAQFEYAGGLIRNSNHTDSALNDVQPVLGTAAALFPLCDVIIDFTSPDATRAHAALAADTNTAMVIGTTGLQPEDIKAIESAAQKTAIVLAPNTSVGVTVLLSLVEQASKLLGNDFDMEIAEIHHKRKVDAPSGTAMALGEAAAKGAALAWPQAKLPARDGITGARPESGIGFGVLRGGDVVGEHTVYYFGEGERVELTHRATDRRLFARGALRAAQWVAAQKPGLYSMKDVLGL